MAHIGATTYFDLCTDSFVVEIFFPSPMNYIFPCPINHILPILYLTHVKCTNLCLDVSVAEIFHMEATFHVF